jgi:predicted TIM-barrel enzyme
MKAHALFGRMSDVVDRLNGTRALAAARAKGLPAGDALRKDLEAFAEKAEAIRKDVVATSEGGAITGEERLREHLGYVYDALLSYEGRPGDYQVERVAVLERELKEVEERAAALAAKDLPALNEKLRAKKLAPIAEAAARD